MPKNIKIKHLKTKGKDKSSEGKRDMTYHCRRIPCLLSVSQWKLRGGTMLFKCWKKCQWWTLHLPKLVSNNERVIDFPRKETKSTCIKRRKVKSAPHWAVCYGRCPLPVSPSLKVPFKWGRERSEGREGLCVVEGNEYVTQCGATCTCLRPMQVLMGKGNLNPSTAEHFETVSTHVALFPLLVYSASWYLWVEGGNLSAYLIS